MQRIDAPTLRAVATHRQAPRHWPRSSSTMNDDARTTRPLDRLGRCCAAAASRPRHAPDRRRRAPARRRRPSPPIPKSPRALNACARRRRRRRRARRLPAARRPEASVGRTSDRITTRNPDSGSAQPQRRGADASTQLLWDGLAHPQRRRARSATTSSRAISSSLDATEQTALEAARALLRRAALPPPGAAGRRQLRAAPVRVRRRSQPRVRPASAAASTSSRPARALALAESQPDHRDRQPARRDGALPAHRRRSRRRSASAAPRRCRPACPPAPARRCDAALRSSPAISAAIENLRAARARRRGPRKRLPAARRSAPARRRRPQLRRRARPEARHHRRGRAELEPVQRRRRPGPRAPADQPREPGRRPARQGLPRRAPDGAIAYNDTRKLVEQLRCLDRNALAIEKARDAYRQQFDIGQRSLLDLLNSENELYTAKRAYANAELRPAARVGAHAGRDASA